MGNGPRSVPAKLLALLDVYSHENTAHSLSELARRTGLPMATAHRLTGELARWGGLERGEDGRYRIGLRLVELAALCPRGYALRDIALPFMEDLYEATHQNVQLAVREGLDGVYIERIAGRQAVPVLTRVGAHWPLHATGVGLILLAHAPADVQEAVLAAPLATFTPFTIRRPGGAAPYAGRDPPHRFRGQRPADHGRRVLGRGPGAERRPGGRLRGLAVDRGPGDRSAPGVLGTRRAGRRERHFPPAQERAVTG